jgi:hypothetical protein
MEYIRLGELPRTGYWRDVINSLNQADKPANITYTTLGCIFKEIPEKLQFE